MDPAPPPSGCSYERDGEAAFVTLKPALSDVKWDEIETIGTNIESRLEADKPAKVVFDISPLSYMGSAMVALVVRWWKTVGKYGGKSVVVCKDDNVLEVLRLAALDKHWTIVDDRAVAHKHLGIRGGPAVTSEETRPVATTTGDSTVSGTGPMLPLIVGGVALPVGIVGAVLYLIRVADPKLTLGLALAGGLTALIAGVLGAVMCTGTRRTASIVVAVFGGLIAGLAGFRLAEANAEPVPARRDVDERDVDSPDPDDDLGAAAERVGDSVREAAGDAADAVDDATSDLQEAGREVSDAIGGGPRDPKRPALSGMAGPAGPVDEGDTAPVAEPDGGGIGPAGPVDESLFDNPQPEGDAVREVPVDD